MNYGKKSTQKREKELTSKSTMIRKKFYVIFCKSLLVCVFAVMVIGACSGVGVIRGIIASAPTIDDIVATPTGFLSTVLDANGNQTATLVASGSNRRAVTIDEIPKNLQHAFVAIEDERFYEHNGIDVTGIIRAGVKGVASGFHFSEGASTITQQLLKNTVFTSWTSESSMADKFERKFQEQYLALQLEKVVDKDWILENYLNTINLGSGCYGVQTAAQTYFGKDAKDLTLSECAVLAAIPKAPTAYNPKNHPEKNQQRRDKILNNMKEQGYITEEEYTIAMNDNVYDRIAMHTQSQAESAPYSYFIDEVITNLINDLMVQKGYTEVQAKNVVYSGGLKIYTTQDSYMQSILDTEFQNPENFPANTQIGLDWALTVEQADGEVQNYSKEMLQLYFRNSDPNFDLLFDSQEEAQSYIDQYKAAIMQEGDTIVAERSSFTPQPQACMTVMDQRTGYVKAIVGGRGEKTASLTFNRATDNYSQPGSTFKILSAYGPALDLGKITLATVIKDEPFNYSDGTPLQNSDLTYHGDVTVRQAIINSINIPAVKVLTELTPKVGFDYLKKLGFSKLSEEYDVIQPLALGGITYGVSDLELTAAYAAIADGGQYRKPVFYTKVTDSKGNVLIDNTENKATQVFKASTASLLTNAMEDVLEKGTGVAARLDNMHAAGKTGTTNEAKDLVFAGFTPYYTAAIWATYDTHAEFPESDREFHKRLWAKVMNEIHEGLADMDFETSATVQEATICTKTGLLARSSCPSITEYFAVSDLPTERCKGHYTAPTSTPTPTRIPSAASTPQATPTPTEAPQETPAPPETPADPPSNTPETPDTPDTPDAPSEPDTPAEISEVQPQSEESGSSE